MRVDMIFLGITLTALMLFTFQNYLELRELKKMQKQVEELEKLEITNH